MDGPQHYREAEGALDVIGHEVTDAEDRAALIGIAQAHATLALVAAHVEAEALRGWDVAR